jgi:UDPglucose 6-dehydrogenase
LVAGVCFAENGHDVVGLDVDEQKIDGLIKGELPIFEPGLSDLFNHSLRAGRLRFTTRYDDATRHAEIIFLCLPTPPACDGSADTRYVISAVHDIAKRMDGYKLIVSKSTVPVGTCARIEQEIRREYRGSFSVASNPEFLKEGTAVEDFLKPDRVIAGVTDDRAWEMLHSVYEPFVRTGAPILRMDPASAELTKYAANGFLATKISFMNEIACLCEKTGADIDQVRAGISKDVRIGPAFLFPGIGYGGSCFPKDVRALVQTGRQNNMDLQILDAAGRVNEQQKLILFPKLLMHFAGALGGKAIAVWGLAFKPRTDDVREAPALALIEKLLSSRVKVSAYDPEAMRNTSRQFGERVRFAADPYDAVDGADALVVATEWNIFRMPDWSRIKRLMRGAAVFDGRNVYRPELVREMGFSYYGIGRR